MLRLKVLCLMGFYCKKLPSATLEYPSHCVSTTIKIKGNGVQNNNAVMVAIIQTPFFNKYLRFTTAVISAKSILIPQIMELTLSQ